MDERGDNRLILRSFGSISDMDERGVDRMPSMVNMAPSFGQRGTAPSLIDGHDTDALAIGLIVFGFGAWQDIAKLSGIDVSVADIESISKRMLENRPGLKAALSPESSRVLSLAIKAAAISLQLNDELMHDYIPQDVDDASLLKALLSSYGREATVTALKTKALLESLMPSSLPDDGDADAAAFVFPSNKLQALASLPSLQHLMRKMNEEAIPHSQALTRSPPNLTAPTTSLTPPRSFEKPGGSFTGRKPPRPVSASPQLSTGAVLSQQVSQEGSKCCGNCGTTSTSLWRKVNEIVMCNACGIYYKNHGYHRPMDLAAKATLSQTSANAHDLQGGGSTGGKQAASHGGGGKKRQGNPISVLAQLQPVSLVIGTSQRVLGEDTATSPLARGLKAKGRKNSFSAIPSKFSPPPNFDVLDGASGEMEEDHAKIEYGLTEDEDGNEDAAMRGARKSGRVRVAKRGFGDEWYEPSDLVLRRDGNPVLKRPRPQSSTGGYVSEGYVSDYMDSQGPGGGGSKGQVRNRPRSSNGGLPPPSPLRAVSAVQGGRRGGVEEDGASPTSVEDLAAPPALNDDPHEPLVNHSPLPSGLDGNGEGDEEGEASDSSDATDLRVDADTSLVALALMQLKEAKGRWGLLPKVLQPGGGGGKRSGNNTPATSFVPDHPQRDTSLSPLRPSPAPPPANPPAARTSSAGGGGRGRSKSPYSNAQRRTSPEVTRTSGGGAAGSIQCCSNCGTMKTPMWRKDKVTGAINCNACGIYRQTHGFDRPTGGSARNSTDGNRAADKGPPGLLTPPGSPLLTHSGAQSLPGPWPNLPPIQGMGQGLPPPSAPLSSLLGGLSRPLGALGPSHPGRPPLPPSTLSRETYPRPSPTSAPIQESPSAAGTFAHTPTNETMKAFEQLLASMPGFPPLVLPQSSRQPQSSSNGPPAPFHFGIGMDLNALNRQIEAQHARQLKELQMHQQQLAILQQLKQHATAMQLSQEKALAGDGERVLVEERCKVDTQGVYDPAKLSIEVPPSLSSLGSELRSNRGGFASPIPLSSPLAAKKPPSPSSKVDPPVTFVP